MLEVKQQRVCAYDQKTFKVTSKSFGYVLGTDFIFSSVNRGLYL